MAEAKSRHGCLTAWLVLMIAANSASAVSSALMYLFGSEAMRQTLPDPPWWTLPVLAVFSLLNLVCAISLFRWKKWGFWGVCVTGVVTLIVNLSVGLGILQALTGLGGVLLLYGVLQIGKENKGWSQLE